MKNLGILLFGLGMLVAICSAAKLTDHARFQAEEPMRKKQREAEQKDVIVPAEEAPPKTTFPSTWPIFVVAIGCAIAGICIWRADRTGSAMDEETPKEQNPVAILSAMQSALRSLQQQFTKMPLTSVLKRVDAIAEEYVFPFNLARGTIVDRLGMRDGAEVLVAFAGAERKLNRTWSAASDGHEAEAATSFDDAVQAFADAERLLQKYLEKA